MTPDTRTLVLHEAVSRQAEKLWERYGRPQGRDEEIWLEAERQVLGADRSANQQPGGAIPAGPLSDVFHPTVQPGPRTEPEVAQERDNRRHGSPREDLRSHGDSDGHAGGQLGAPGADTGLPK